MIFFALLRSTSQLTDTQVRWDWEPQNNPNNQGAWKGVHINFEITPKGSGGSGGSAQTFAVYNTAVRSPQQFMQKLKENADQAGWDMNQGTWKGGQTRFDEAATKTGVRALAKRWAAIRGNGGPCPA